ncbi:unnamed protein product [Trichobilharzia regenti]|nr:unnamed protein product [Trichobilharzia regenti]
MPQVFGAPNPHDYIPDKESGLCLNYGYLLTRVCAVPKDLSVFAAFKDIFRRAGDCPIQARLMRLRCPLTMVDGGCGQGEWKGPYSSASSEWDEINLEARKRLGLTFDSETEFWMPLESVLEHMSGVLTCRFPDTSLYYFDITNDSDEVLLSLVRKYNRDPLTMVIEPDLSVLSVGLGLFKFTIRVVVNRYINMYCNNNNNNDQP